MARLLGLVVVSLLSSGCLVLSVNPSHEREALLWDPALLGSWHNADDNSSIAFERAEWHSYKITYTHPIETGLLTGYLTRIGDARYLDVMPARGQDRGSFVLPVHATLRVNLDGDRLELTALSYDWFFDRLRTRTRIPGLAIVRDEKENALVVSSTPEWRAWLSKQPAEGAMFGASAMFVRK